MTKGEPASDGLRLALQLIREAFNLERPNEFRDKAYQIQEIILSVQEKIISSRAENLAMGQRVRELEEQIAELSVWQREAGRYVLKDFGGETYAYVLRKELTNEETPHNLCATCFHSKRKSILHYSGRTDHQEMYRCFSCDKIFFMGDRVASHQNNYRADNGDDWLR